MPAAAEDRRKASVPAGATALDQGRPEAPGQGAGRLRRAGIGRGKVTHGVGVLWATHLIDEIWPQDRVVVLHQGKVLATGSAAEIAGDAGLSEAFLTMTKGQAA